MRPLILLTNDDGYEAPGLAALRSAVADLGEVVSVAPDRERSGAGHALTLGRPLRVREHGRGMFVVDGTPTDCVHLAVFRLTRGRAPDLVLSGINRGLNLGDDVTYSGTVAGALEATLLHVPAVAVSAAIDDRGDAEYGPASRIARRVAERVLRDGLPTGVFLNVNVPRGRPSKVRVTRQGTRTYRAAVVERLDPSGRPYYWIAAADTTPAGEEDGDHRAIADGAISITPLHANMTSEGFRRALERWELQID